MSSDGFLAQEDDVRVSHIMREGMPANIDLFQGEEEDEFDQGQICVNIC